ncbi:MAG: hypothetical protein Q9195_007733 [Heterodermia aff. obscurata]
MGMLDQHYQRIKNVIHGIQGLGIVVAWIITIAVFTRPGKSGGQTKYFFALCWFTIPVLIYQTAVPIFTRTKRFSNPYAHTALDVLFTILWLAAFAAVAAWTNQGISAVKDRKPDEKGCDRLLFATTSALSIYALLYYRRNGSLPSSTPTNGAVPITDHAFSSNPHDDDPFEHDELHNADDHNDPAYDPHIGRGRRDHDDEYQSIHTDTEEGTHLGRPLSWGQHPHQHPQEQQNQYEDTSYHGAYNNQQPPPAQDPFRNPSPYRQPNAAPQLPPIGGAGGDPFRDEFRVGAGGRVDIPDASDYRPGSRLA